MTIPVSGGIPSPSSAAARSSDGVHLLYRHVHRIPMATRILADMTLCSYEIVITAEDLGNGTVSLDIRSDCEEVQRYAAMLGDVAIEELDDLDSRIMRTAAQAGLTATCLVPSAVYNACWLEVGMISKNLARGKGPVSITLLDDPVRG
jgi:hypothetical protein